MGNGKDRIHFAISHLPFPITPSSISGLLGFGTTMKSFGIGWCIAALLTLTALAQAPPRGFWVPSARFVLVGVEMQTPTFKSAVDLVPVDVSIVDKTGRPVRGLEASDFVLSIDGRPRKIESTQFISSASADPPPPTPSYYSSNTSAGGGRLIMLVVDRGNIGIGRGKVALDGARRFISSLGPADRVGVVAIPGAGPHIDFTSNHASVEAMLPKLFGTASAPEGQYRVGTSEAFQIDRGDEMALRQAVERECAGNRGPDLEACASQLRSDANQLYHDIRERSVNSLMALRYLVERLAQAPSPKAVVFISEGLVIDRELADVTWLGPLAARGQVVIHVLQLDQPQMDASLPRMSPTRGADTSLAEEGLGMLAGLTRGALMKVVSSADAAFTRLGLELSAYYLLSFAPEPGDRDGKPHKIKVDVQGRRGIEVRARTQFSIDPPHAATEENALADAIRAPLLATEIGLRVSTYSLRDPATGKLKVLFAAEIDRSSNDGGHLALAFSLTDASGTIVASQFVPDAHAPVRSASKTQTFVGSVLAGSPGVYTLKLAVVDASGKKGSVERTFSAQLTSTGQVRATDLLIAENTGAATGGVVPAVATDFSSDLLHGYLEVYSDAADVLEHATVTIEVADTEDGRALDGAAARLQPVSADAPGRRVAEGSVSIALLPPGEYVARAVISINGRKAGQVTRPFKIGRSAIAAASASGKPVTGGRPPIPFSSRIDAFDRGSVLTPPVVGFFLDRMNVGRNGPTPAASAIDHARNARFDAAIEALKDAGDDPLSVAFLNGLALLAKGQLEAAAGKFRETLKIDSEFLPAAFYLGSCYAAGGRDKEAVGAWQTSLVTESDAPFIYTLLGDALLRLREIDQSIEILNEASTLWPENEAVQMRLGTALVMGGKRTEALQILEPYLQKHPEDQERRFMALQALYEAHSQGRSIKSADEDRALFARYANEYVAANGPQAALVEKWKKVMQK
jgi:VWFA-related protein